MMIATPIADMIAEMHASGIQLEMIIVAVRSMERVLSTRQGVDEVAERRRAWDREYRRNKRERPPDPPDIHPIPPDVGNNALSFLKEDKKLSELEVKKERKQESKKERGCKLPPDWIPKLRHYEEGAKRGMNRDAVDDRAVRMREWCDANANRSITTKANWDSAFMGTWIKGSNNGNAAGNHRTVSATGRATSREADQIAAMGRGAANRLAMRATAGPDNGETPGSAGSAEVFDIRKRAETAY